MKLAKSIGFVILLSTQISFAQISIDVDGSPVTYVQNFDDVYPASDADRDSGDDNTWTNNSTLTGWYAAKESGPSYFTEYRISAGNETSSTRLYSYGHVKTDPNASDRALGFQTSSTIGNSALAVLFENIGSNTINSISIHVTGEQWRKNGGCTKGQQRVKIGYHIDNNISSTLTDPSNGPELIINGSFNEIPEAFLVNMDTTSSSATPLDGNDAANRSVLSLTFPVNFPPGSHLLLRFYDEEYSCGSADPPIALDDLTLIFSTQAKNTTINPAELNALEAGNHTIAQYLSNIAKNIPENPDNFPEAGYPVYTAPTNPEYAAWTTILTDFYVNHNFTNVSSSVGTYGYELVTFPKEGDPSNPYQVLRKKPESTNYWGTMVVNPNASTAGFVNNLNLQAPHIANDQDTGVQGASVLMHTDAYSFVMAGADRCSNDVSTGCSGSGKCNNGEGNYHSTADLAHDSFNLMDLSMRIIAEDNDLSQFVQLHGFSSSGRDFDFVISNGTNYTPADASRDFAYKLAEELRNIDPASIPGKSSNFDPRVPHKGDEITELKGFTNNQGKWLNNIGDNSFDPCTDGASSTSNGRFIHLEQYNDIRENHVMHILLSNAIMGALGSTLPVELISFTVTSDWDGNAVLSWIVASETNHHSYEIERSADGHHFDVIGMIENSDQSFPKTYKWVDKNLHFSPAYYRIKQIDYSGAYTYFPIRIFKATFENKIKISPNPGKDFLEIQGSEKPDILYHLSGKQEILKFSKTGLDRFRLDIKHLPPGIYILQLKGQFIKFIKE